MTRVRVRRDRPTPLAWAVALCVTMLAVYVLTLDVSGPDVVESMAAAPRVTREIAFDALEGWCVRMARCDTEQEARLRASATVSRGAAGYVTRLDDGWAVLGAVYESEKDARRIAARLADEADIRADVVPIRARAVKLRVTAPQAQIDAIAGADALLREQTRRLGQMALQLDRGELRPDAARTLFAVAAGEAKEAAAALSAIPGAAENGLCAGLIGRVEALCGLLEALSTESGSGGAAYSGMVRCAQTDTFVRQAAFQETVNRNGKQ